MTRRSIVLSDYLKDMGSKELLNEGLIILDSSPYFEEVHYIGSNESITIVPRIEINNPRHNSAADLSAARIVYFREVSQKFQRHVNCFFTTEGDEFSRAFHKNCNQLLIAVAIGLLEIN